MALTVTRYSGTSITVATINTPEAVYTVPVGKVAKVVMNNYVEAALGVYALHVLVDNVDNTAYKGNRLYTSSSSHGGQMYAGSSLILSTKTATAAQSRATISMQDTTDGTGVIAYHYVNVATEQSRELTEATANAIITKNEFIMLAGESFTLQGSHSGGVKFAYDFTVYEDDL